MGFKSDVREELYLSSPSLDPFGVLYQYFVPQRAIVLAFDLAFGEDTGPKARWLNNRRISPDDRKSLIAFKSEPEYHLNYP